MEKVTFFLLRLADYGDNKIHVLKRRNDYKCKITFLLILIKFYIICIIIGMLQGLNINKLSYSWMVGKLSNINISSSVFIFSTHSWRFMQIITILSCSNLFEVQFNANFKTFIKIYKSTCYGRWSLHY